MWGGVAVSVVTALLVARARTTTAQACGSWSATSTALVRTADHDSPIPTARCTRADHARRPAARRFVPQHAGGLLRSDLGLWRVFQSLREMRRKQPLSVGIIGLARVVRLMQPATRWSSTRSARGRRHCEARVHLPCRHASAHRAGHGRRAPVARAPSRRAATTVLRGRLFRRFDPDAPGDAPRRWRFTSSTSGPTAVIVFQATNRFIDLLPW